VAGRYLTAGEAAALIWPDAQAAEPGIGKTTVNTLFDTGLLRGYRTGGRQRRIEAASVEELNEVRRLPRNTDEQIAVYYAALARLKQHNAGLPPPTVD
jgi:excisionase family DNA binding protein